MKAYLSHGTALEYWRKHFPLDSELFAFANTSEIEPCASRKEDVFECVPETFRIPDKPIDVLVFDPSARCSSASIRSHVFSAALPRDAFYRVGNMLVSSPEFVFLQLAQHLSLVKTIALGCELCGTYVLAAQGEERIDTSNDYPTRVAPLTSTARIDAFLSKAKGAHGVVKARHALKYVIDMARSPMETMVYMLLCLPPKLGGYGFPRPEMNAEIPLDYAARLIAHRQTCYGDICWPGSKLDVEYYGDVHAGAVHMKSDTGRTLGIEHMGWRVITLTSPQVFDELQFDVVAKSVAEKVGKRLTRRALESSPARANLRFELSDWQRSS